MVDWEGRSEIGCVEEVSMNKKYVKRKIPYKAKKERFIVAMQNKKRSVTPGTIWDIFSAIS